MTTPMRSLALIIIAAIIVLGGVAWFLQSQNTGNEREGTEQLTAEQVIDLEVQADQEYQKTQNQ